MIKALSMLVSSTFSNSVFLFASKRAIWASKLSLFSKAVNSANFNLSSCLFLFKVSSNANSWSLCSSNAKRSLSFAANNAFDCSSMYFIESALAFSLSAFSLSKRAFLFS